MMKKKYVLIGIIILVLLIGTPLISILLLNSEWLRQQLVTKVSSNLHADLSIESLTFDVLQGKASLAGVAFSREDETSDLDMQLESAEMEVEILPLFYRSIQIRRLELAGPQVTSVVRHLPIPKKEERPSEQKKPPKKKTEFTIADLLILDGVIDFTVIRKGHEPFQARITDIRYSAKNITPDSLLEMLYGSDLHCKIEMGTVATLEKSGTSSPATFTLKDMSLPDVSKYFEASQRDLKISATEITERSSFWENMKEKVNNLLDDSSDPLHITDGMMDTSYILGKDRVHVKVDLKNLILASDSEESEQTFMFIPLERIIEYVEQKEGNLTLEFDLDEEVRTSTDLEFILNEFWKGLWIAILKEISPESVDELIEKGTQKALNFLQREKEK